jgi:hypothetical protein
MLWIPNAQPLGTSENTPRVRNSAPLVTEGDAAFAAQRNMT